MNIKTSNDHPPIPSRQFDWSAIDADTYDGAPDSPTRNQVGHGPTEQGAIADLKRQLAEANPNAGIVPAYPRGRWTGGAK